jgi:hypothetical protein
MQVGQVIRACLEAPHLVDHFAGKQLVDEPPAHGPAADALAANIVVPQLCDSGRLLEVRQDLRDAERVAQQGARKRTAEFMPRVAAPHVSRNFEEIVGHTFHDSGLRQQACTHPYASTRLHATLGHNFVCSDHLSHACGTHSTHLSWRAS